MFRGWSRGVKFGAFTQNPSMLGFLQLCHFLGSINEKYVLSFLRFIKLFHVQFCFHVFHISMYVYCCQYISRLYVRNLSFLDGPYIINCISYMWMMTEMEFILRQMLCFSYQPLFLFLLKVFQEIHPYIGASCFTGISLISTVITLRYFD